LRSILDIPMFLQAKGDICRKEIQKINNMLCSSRRVGEYIEKSANEMKYEASSVFMKHYFAVDLSEQVIYFVPEHRQRGVADDFHFFQLRNCQQRRK